MKPGARKGAIEVQPVMEHAGLPEILPAASALPEGSPTTSGRFLLGQLHRCTMPLKIMPLAGRIAMLKRFLIIVITCPAWAGCGLFIDGTVCTAEFAYGLTVNVTDEDGNPVNDATFTLTEGDYVEIIPGPPGSGAMVSDGVYVGAGERPGTYMLTVEADGFEPVTIENIVIRADECHVIGVTRDVVLLTE